MGGWGQGSPTGGRHDDGYESDGRQPDFGQRRPVRHDRREPPRESGRPEAERNRRYDPNELGRPDMGRNGPKDRPEIGRPDVGRNRPTDRPDVGRADDERNRLNDRTDIGRPRVGEDRPINRRKMSPPDVERRRPGDPRDHRYSPNGRGYPPRERETNPSRERAQGPGDPYRGFRPEEPRSRRPSGPPPRYNPEDRWDERDHGRFPPKDDALPTRDYNQGQRRFTPKEQVPPNRRFTPQEQRNARKNTPFDPRAPSDFESDRNDHRRPGEPPRGRSPYDRDDVSWGPRFPTDGPYGRNEAPPSDRRGHDMPPGERRGQPMHSHPYSQGGVAPGFRPDYPPDPSSRGEPPYQNTSTPRVPEGPYRPVPKAGPYPERENGYISDASSRYRPRDDSYQSDDENSRSSQNDGYEIPAKKPNRGFSYAPKESLERSFNHGTYNPPTPKPGGVRRPKSLEDISDEDRGHPEGQSTFAEEYRQKPKAYPTAQSQYPEKSEDPTEDEVIFLSATLAYWLIGVGVACIVVGTVGLFFCMTWHAMAGAPLWSGLCVVATGGLAIVNNKHPSKFVTTVFVVVAVVALLLQLVNAGITASGLSIAVDIIKEINVNGGQRAAVPTPAPGFNIIFWNTAIYAFVSTPNLMFYVNIAMFVVILLTSVVANVLLIFVLAKTVQKLRQRKQQKGERNISMMNLPQAEHVQPVNPPHSQIHYMDSLT
ncbi:extensin-like [Branchiostoma floridae]|uniref:Extensin-like n=1 Tax=Branchiostoma floridae TaxID=7739 RepID=A0A9J7HHJ0_BRAFL|nr:extensin-like [Branchiostoma floridae]